MATLDQTYAGSYLNTSVSSASGDTNDPLVQAVKEVPSRWIGLFFQNFAHSTETTGMRLLQNTPPRAKVASMRPEYAAELGITLQGMHVADNWRITVDRQRLTQSDPQGNDVWALQGKSVVIAEVLNPHPGALMLFSGSQKSDYWQRPRFTEPSYNGGRMTHAIFGIVGMENQKNRDSILFGAPEWQHPQVHPSASFREALDHVLERLLHDTPFGKGVDAAPKPITERLDISL